MIIASLVLLAIGRASLVSSSPCPLGSSYLPCKCEIVKTHFGANNKHVDCSALDLEDIPDNLHSGLKQIDLSHNRIKPENIKKLKRFRFKTHVYLGFNDLKTIPDDAFKGVISTTIRYIDFEGNVFEEIKNKTFSGLEGVREMHGLEAKWFDGDCFQGFKRLETFSVVFHQTNIPENIFDNLQLMSLYVTFLNATELPVKLFHFGQRVLVDLEIVSPNLLEVNQNLFYGLSVLRSLTIRTNTLNTLPSYLLHNVLHTTNDTENMPVNLKEVVLDGVKSLPHQLFHDQQTIESIELHGVEDIPSNLFKNLVTLDTLDISGCPVGHGSVSPEWFTDLSTLKTLNISSCELSRLEESDFRSLTSLVNLDASHNSVSVIEGSAVHSFRYVLETLDLSHNNLTSLDYSMFENMRVLKYLDVSYNKITSLKDELFKDLGQLTVLLLQNNQISILPETLVLSLEKLQKMDLSNNAISVIPQEFLKHSLSLQYLNLSSNSINSVPTVHDNDDLREIDLTDNPVLCDCSVEILRNRTVDVLLKGICHGPAGLKGIILMNVPFKMECTKKASESDSLQHGIEPSPVSFTPSTVYGSFDARSGEEILMTEIPVTKNNFDTTPLPIFEFARDLGNASNATNISSTPTMMVTPTDPDATSTFVYDPEVFTIGFYISVVVVSVFVLAVGGGVLSGVYFARRRRSSQYEVASQQMLHIRTTTSEERKRSCSLPEISETEEMAGVVPFTSEETVKINNNMLKPPE